MALQFLPVLATGLNALASGAAFFGSRRAGNAAYDDAIARGEFEAEQYRRRLVGLIGSQRASFAAQGLDVSFGSPAEIMQETEDIGEADIAQIRENAMREAMGLRSQFRAQSWAAGASAFSSLASLGANAWDSYRQRTANARVQGFNASQPLGA